MWLLWRAAYRTRSAPEQLLRFARHAAENFAGRCDVTDETDGLADPHAGVVDVARGPGGVGVDDGAVYDAVKAAQLTIYQQLR